MDNKMQLRKLKDIELSMLKIFIDICRRHNLTYFLLGGTALGAVRHKGFIPWDDDIDVGMPRGDYEKFLDIAQGELPEYLFLQTHKTDANYPMNFAKIRNSDTTFIETSVQNIKMNHGIYIDVFPLDGYPKGKIREFIRDIKDIIFSKAIRKSLYFEEKQKQTKLGYITSLIVFLFFRDYRKAVKSKERLMSKYNYNNSDIVANYCGAWKKKEVMPKLYFGSGAVGEFEGIEVILAEDYDKYLTSLYGDYMTPPPPEKRIAHHFCTVIDTDKSYKEYINLGE